MFISIDSRRACALLVTLLLPACADKDEGGADTDAAATDTDATATDTDATATDTDATPAGCECADSAPCSVPLCPKVVFEEDYDSGGEAETEGDAALDEALTCALGALRDGKAGRITAWSGINGGQFFDEVSLDLFGDGTARRTLGGAEDLCIYSPDEVSVRSLKAAQVFTDCLAEPDVKKRVDCVFAATEAAITVCQAGGTDCSGI